MSKRVVSFVTFKKYCQHRFDNWVSRGDKYKVFSMCGKRSPQRACHQSNCPIWKRLKKPEPVFTLDKS